MMSSHHSTQLKLQRRRVSQDESFGSSCDGVFVAVCRVNGNQYFLRQHTDHLITATTCQHVSLLLYWIVLDMMKDYLQTIIASCTMPAAK